MLRSIWWLIVVAGGAGFIAIAAAQQDSPAMAQYVQAVTHHNEALKLLEEKKYTEGNAARAQGITAYKKAIELDPGLVDAYINLGDLYRKNAPGPADVTLALEAYQKAVTLKPGDAGIYNRINFAHWSLGNVAQSLAATEQAARLSPTTPVYVYNLGFQHANQGNFAEARRAHARLQGLDPATAIKLLAEIQKASGESSLVGRPTKYGNPKIELVSIKPGTFDMGIYEIGKAPIPGHLKVVIRNGFYIGKYPVTQAQWQAVMGDNPSFFKNCGGSCPVEQVSWHDAQAFITRLNQLMDGYIYRLPSEAEWEYAYRAGTRTLSYAEGDIGWHSGNSGNKTHPVGQKLPNAFGLYDMNSHVKEWCADWYTEKGGTADGSAVDQVGDRMKRVLRGNSFYSMDASGAIKRTADRVDEVSRNNGFRVAAQKVGAKN